MAVNLYVKKINRNTYNLAIRPYFGNSRDHYEVKETIRKSMGFPDFDNINMEWVCKLKYYPNLYKQFCDLCINKGIKINIHGFSDLHEALKKNGYIPQTSVVQPSLFSGPNANYSENKKNMEKQEKEASPKIIKPVFSEENCIYSGICMNCAEKCCDFVSVSDAMKNRDTVPSYSVNEKEIKDPKVTWTGSSAAASGTGRYADDSEGFIVFSGSRMSEKIARKLSRVHKNTREMLKKEGFVDENNVFVKNFLFSSPNEAAAVLTGSTASWIEFWHAETGERAMCKGNFIEKSTPATAVITVNGQSLFGTPVVGAGLYFKVFKGNIIQPVSVGSLSKNATYRRVELESKSDRKTGQLLDDVICSSAAEAAQIITGDPKADASLWKITDSITMKDVEKQYEIASVDGKDVYHNIHPSKGAAASLYKKDDKKYVLMKGSLVTPLLSVSMPNTYLQVYRKLRTSGIIKNGVITEDVEFSSPTPPAAVVTGMSQNGSKEWVKKNGECLNEENRSRKEERI